MATVGNDYFREQLEVRRQRLVTASAGARANAEISGLLQEVDLALERIKKDTFGICEVCNSGIEADRLVADPTVRICIDHLTPEQRRKLEDDLHLASRVQRGLLPPQPVRADGWQIHYHYQPAGLVSGDYCDLIFPRNGGGEMIFLMGDVSGKGVAASMLMTQLHATFRSLVKVALSLEELLASANHMLTESALSGHYATLVAGRANRSGEVEIASAGHVPVLLAGCDGVKSVPATGLPLGLFEDSRYGSHKIAMKPGDALVLYTDGLSETLDSAGIQYGEKRLAEFFGKQRKLPAQALTSACLADLNVFGGGKQPADDLTLMVIQRAA
jgi:phosphoserine phosphatase RsbU/P